MGKVKSHTPKLTKKFYPFVSVCTPTFNRRPFIPIMFSCFNNQTYPKDRMEWIIVDDGTDPIEDLVSSSGIQNIRYFKQERKMALGEKRNFMHSKVKGTIVVYMDDDDYYPPERVQHAVDTLTNNREALCAGSSEIYVYFKHIHQMYQSGPYGPNHATAGTFAFRTELLKTCKYEDHAALAEEKHFLKNYTVPFAQLDPLKTILVFSHEHNTFDKRKLLENQNEQYFKPSPRSVDEFIRRTDEAHIKQFFMTDIDGLLANYAPGEPAMKPDVLKQIKEIEEERAKMTQQTIMINEPGKPPRPMTNNEVVMIVNQQNEQLRTLTEKNQELETMVANLQKKIASMNQISPIEPSLESLSPTITPTTPTPSFVDTLLSKIKDLENQLSSQQSAPPPPSSPPPSSPLPSPSSLLQRIEELEIQNRLLLQRVQTTSLPTPPMPVSKSIPQIPTPMPSKSKSMPEVNVSIL